MCYSAMVEQEAKKLGMKFGVRVQLDLYEDLFARREGGEKITINKAMESQFLLSPETAQEKRIAAAIRKWREDQIAQLERKLANDEKRISPLRVNQMQFRLKKLKTNDYLSDDEKSVFPMAYLSMIVAGEDGGLVVAPFRYHLRPSGQPPTFDRKYNGCYNARRDNLHNPFWRPLFGKRHGLIVVKKFYEHVPTEDYLKKFDLPEELKAKKSIILGFEPGEGQPDLYSCALITDEPPPEIAETGHSRCPVFLKESNIETWLHPKGRSLEELDAILGERERPRYRHALIDAA